MLFTSVFRSPARSVIGDSDEQRQAATVGDRRSGASGCVALDEFMGVS